MPEVMLQKDKKLESKWRRAVTPCNSHELIYRHLLGVANSHLRTHHSVWSYSTFRVTFIYNTTRKRNIHCKTLRNRSGTHVRAHTHTISSLSSKHPSNLVLHNYQGNHFKNDFLRIFPPRT